MSLSNGQGAPSRPPRVIMGMGSNGPDETTVAELQGQRDLTRWTEKTEEEYMTRVRDRATGAAKQIIAKAMAEAEAIRQNAMNEGYEAAAQEAQAQLDTAVTSYADSLAAAMAAIEQGQATLRAEQGADVTALVRLAVERVLNIELEERRSDILASVLDQALEAIDSQRQLCVRVHPQDEETICGLMDFAKQRHPGLDKWCVRADESLAPGGMVLESVQGMVDNSMEGRLAAVMEVLDHLGTPGNADASAEDASAGQQSGATLPMDHPGEEQPG